MAINVSVQCSGGQIFLSLQPMKQYIITTLFDMYYYCVPVSLLLFVQCPCMAINVSVQYNGGLLPDTVLLTECYCHHIIGETRLNTTRRGFVVAPMIPPY